MVGWFLNEAVAKAQLFRISLHCYKKRDYRQDIHSQILRCINDEKETKYWECCCVLDCSDLGCEGGLIFLEELQVTEL